MRFKPGTLFYQQPSKWRQAAGRSTMSSKMYNQHALNDYRPGLYNHMPQILKKKSKWNYQLENQHQNNKYQNHEGTTYFQINIRQLQHLHSLLSFFPQNSKVVQLYHLEFLFKSLLKFLLISCKPISPLPNLQQCH